MCALHLAYEGKIIVSESTLSRELLEQLVVENPQDLAAITPRHREILELLI